MEFKSSFCIDEGYIYLYCNNCDFSKFSTIPPIAPDFIETNRIPATCTAAGFSLSACFLCDLSVTRVLPKLGGDHTWTETSRTDAACAADGSVESVCSRCGETKTDILSALEHDYKESNRIEPTCTVVGSAIVCYSRYGDAVTEIIPALGMERTYPGGNSADIGHGYRARFRKIYLFCLRRFKTERIPTIGTDLAMSGFLGNISEVFSSAVEWVQIVSDVISINPVLLICVVLAFIGTGIVLFRRLLKVGG